MKHTISSKNNNISILALGALLLLPSCGLTDWVKGGGSSSADKMGAARYNTNDGSNVLATIDGKPLITKNMLESEKKKLIESNPQLQAMIALMDEKQLDRNLMDGLTSREVIRKYIKDNQVEQSDKYKKDFEMVLAQVRDALNTRYFMEAFVEQATEDEIKGFYDANKDAIPSLLISRGGVEAKGVPFGDRQLAKDFATKVKSDKNNIDKVAKSGGFENKLKNFRLVNDETVGIDEELKNKIIAIQSFPHVEVVKSGNEFWVIVATKKEDARYRPLEQVRAELKQQIEKDKTMKRFEDEVARLKGEYNIRIDETFFADNAQDNAAALQASAQEEFEAAQAVAGNVNSDATPAAPAVEPAQVA